MDLINTPNIFWAPERKLGGGWRCFKSSPSQPSAPDPQKTAAAQTQSNIATANAVANLNHTNQYTPWGNQIYTSTPNSDGTSSWTSTINLSPAQQQLLDAQNAQSLGLSQLATQQLGSVKNAISSPINYGAAPGVRDNWATGSFDGVKGVQDQLDLSGVPTLVGGDALAGAMKDSQGAAYRQQSAYLDSSYGQKQKALENQLIQQGVTQGSDAWNRAMSNLGEQRTFDYNNAFNNSFATGLAANNQLYNQGLSSNQNAFGQALARGNFANSAQQQTFNQMLGRTQLGNQAAAQNFGQSMANRQQNLTEQAQAQQIPINILNALRSGSQVSAPQFGATPQGTVANTDLASLYGQQYQGQLGAYNSQMAGNNALTGVLGTLGAAGIMSPAGTFSGLAALLSDRRLKTNVRRVGTHALGIGLYTYDYIWGEAGSGVMADEVEQVKPEAISYHPSGFKMVNYGML